MHRQEMMHFMSSSCENIRASFNTSMMLNMTLVLFFFTGFSTVGFSTGALESKACLYKAAGDTFEIPLSDGDDVLHPDSSLSWTQNEKRVYAKRGSTIKHKIFNISTRGSLIVEHAQVKHSGIFKAEVYSKDGVLLKQAEVQLCVRDPVPEPTVAVKCAESEALLTCGASSSTEAMTRSWVRDGTEALNVPNAVLRVNGSELRRAHRFSCTLRNEISEKTSAEVQPQCPHTGTKTNETSDEENTNDDWSKPSLFGMDLWWILVLVSGVFVLLMLIIVCFCCRTKAKKAKEEEEFGLAALVSDEPDQKDSEKSERLSKSQRPLPPVPSPRSPSPTLPYM